jgi:Flp pilus assembly protein TadG
MAAIKKIFQNKRESGNAFLDFIFVVLFFLLVLAMLFKYDYVINTFKDFFRKVFNF